MSLPSINGLPLVQSSRALADEDSDQVPDLSWRGLLLSFGCFDVCVRACARTRALKHACMPMSMLASMRISA